MHVIYSSIDDAVINWTHEELDAIKNHKEVFRSSREYDVLGMYYQYDDRDYYVFISAEDKYGNRKLRYLKFVLLGASVIGISAVWFIAFYLSKKTLKPLDRLRRQMLHITSKNLTARVQEPDQEDEIKALSQSFNQMLDRIDKAYKGQKDFTSNASHELRTPVARIVMQLENLLQEKNNTEERKVLQSIAEDAYQLSDIVTSLLVLSKMEDSGEVSSFQAIRLDEVVFHVASQLSRIHPDFKLNFEIESSTANNLTLEVKGDETLLRIALLNLMKNAYFYSDNQLVRCYIGQDEGSLKLTITNSGDVPNVTDTTQLFQAFTRGSNSSRSQGSGIGLSIVRRILHHHNASIVYNLPNARTNQLIVTFPAANAG
jgi:signal transduction histidine kinase